MPTMSGRRLDEVGGAGAMPHRIPTLVEVKRGTETRNRREVVGQILDYAANSFCTGPSTP